MTFAHFAIPNIKSRTLIELYSRKTMKYKKRSKRKKSRRRKMRREKARREGKEKNAEETNKINSQALFKFQEQTRAMNGERPILKYKTQLQ